MATSQHINTAAVFHVPLTGRRDRARVVVGHAKTLDDSFTRDSLAPLFWNLSNMGYAYRRAPRPSRSVILLHCVIFSHYHGPVPCGMEVDHIDRDPLNNMPNNLRVLTHSDNIANQRRRPHRSESGLTGVYLINRGMPKPWQAKITVRGRKLSLRYYATPEEAAAAVNAAYAEHFPHTPPPNPV